MKKVIGLILSAILLMGTFTACKSKESTLSDNSLTENENSSCLSSENTTVVTENESGKLAGENESTANSSEAFVPRESKADTTASKITPARNNTSADSIGDVTAKPDSGSSQKTEDEPKNKIETRTYKTDVFSIEIPVSLDGKYRVDYYGSIEKGSLAMHIIVPDADYYAICAGISFYASINSDSDYSDPECFSKSGDWSVSYFHPEGPEYVEAYTPEAMENFVALFAQKDFIISSFKWLI